MLFVLRLRATVSLYEQREWPWARSESWVAELRVQFVEDRCQSHSLFRREAPGATADLAAAHEAAARIDGGLQVGLVENPDSPLADIRSLEFAHAIERRIHDRRIDFPIGAIRPEQMRQHCAYLARIRSQILIAYRNHPERMPRSEPAADIVLPTAHAELQPARVSAVLDERIDIPVEFLARLAGNACTAPRIMEIRLEHIRRLTHDVDRGGRALRERQRRGMQKVRLDQS